MGRVINRQPCRQSPFLYDACQKNANCVRDGQADIRQSGGGLRLEVIVHSDVEH